MSEADAGKRIDVFLNEQVESLSRNTIKGLIQQQCIKLGYQLVQDFGEQIQINDKIFLQYDPEKKYSFRVKKQSRRIEIIADKKDYMIVEKDHGVPSFKRNKFEKSVFQYINDYIKSKSNKRFSKVYPLISLDKSISGLVMVARNESAHREYQKQFKLSGFHLKYIALVKGDLQKKTGRFSQTTENETQELSYSLRKSKDGSHLMELSSKETELKSIENLLQSADLKLQRVPGKVKGKTRPALHAYLISFKDIQSKKSVKYSIRIPATIFGL